jgi:hypothetical protein
MKENLQDIIDNEWQKAREIYFFPQLPKPRVIDGEGNSEINMRSLAITVSEPFIRSFPSSNTRINTLHEISRLIP